VVGGPPDRLSTKEFDLLALLASAAGATVSRQRLTAEVWQRSHLGRSRTLDVQIATLRAWVRDAVAIESVRGVGYRLLVPRPVALA